MGASRFPDVVVQADAGFLVFENPQSIINLPLGLHGWPPESPDMHGIFLAAGPRLPAAMQINAVSVLDVYPLVLDILEIPLAVSIDGDPDVLTGLLQP